VLIAVLLHAGINASSEMASNDYKGWARYVSTNYKTFVPKCKLYF
jgi:hypothetical protein